MTCYHSRRAFCTCHGSPVRPSLSQHPAPAGGGPPLPHARRPVTVLQVLPQLETGGVERETIEIAAAQAAAGYRALVASFGGRMVAELESVGAQHVRLPVHSKNPLVMAANVGRLVRLIEAENVDIVHARSRAPAWPTLAAARRTHTPFVTTFHGTYSTHNPLIRFYNSVMVRGDRVIAVSEFIGEHIRRHYRVDPQRIVVIPRGVDVVEYCAADVGADRVAVWQEKWRLPAGKKIVILPGRLTRWKGQVVMLEALAKLDRADLACVLVGSDQGRRQYTAELRKLAERLGIQYRVIIPGECSDMPASYLLADVVVSASTDPEAFGRVIAEGQAMGRPVIGTAHGGGKEIVAPGTGWLVPPGDPQALAQAITEVLNLNAAALARLGERAAANVRERFNLTNMCSQTLALYESMIEAHGHHGPSSG